MSESFFLLKIKKYRLKFIYIEKRTGVNLNFGMRKIARNYALINSNDLLRWYPIFNDVAVNQSLRGFFFCLEIFYGFCDYLLIMNFTEWNGWMLGGFEWSAGVWLKMLITKQLLRAYNSSAHEPNFSI